MTAGLSEMYFNNGKCFLFDGYQNKTDRNPRSMQEQSKGCRFTFPPCLYIIPRVETQVLPSRVHAHDHMGGRWEGAVYSGTTLCQLSDIPQT